MSSRFEKRIASGGYAGSGGSGSGIAEWNPIQDPDKIVAGESISPNTFVLTADFGGTIDDVTACNKGTLIHYYEASARWGFASGEDKNKGVFQTIAQLQTQYPTTAVGDYALVIETETFFAFYENTWNDTGSNVAPDALRSTNNLNDLSNKETARVNLGVYSRTQIDTSLAGKQDKEAGKGLSEQNYTTAEKNKVANLPENINASLAGKVDKIGAVVGGVFGSANQTSKVTLEDNGLVSEAESIAISITSSQVTDIAETIHDGVNTLLTDTSTISKSYDDTAGTLSLSVKDDSLTNQHISANAGIEASKIKQTTITPVDSIITNGMTQEEINNALQGQATAIKTLATHANRSTLDATQEAFTTEKQTNYGTAYTHSQATGNPHGTTIGDIAGLELSLGAKELSANKITTFSATPTDTQYPSAKLVKDSLTLKVNIETGKSLISDGDLLKLTGIQAGAEVNVNADWNATTGDAQILNKPTLATASAKDVGSAMGQLQENGSALLANRTVETDENGKFKTVEKATGYNLPLGTVAGTVVEGGTVYLKGEVDTFIAGAKNRANHTGMQEISTIAGLQGQLEAKASYEYLFGTGTTIKSSLTNPADKPDLKTVANQSERFALTEINVQKSDEVYQSDTGILYKVFDVTNLNNENGYIVLNGSGTSGVTNWNDITNKPTDILLYNTHTTDILPEGTNNKFVTLAGKTALATMAGASSNGFAKFTNGVPTMQTSITNSDVASGIDATKIGNGSVSNLEFQTLDGFNTATTIEARFSTAESNIALKANQATTYTKSEVNDLLSTFSTSGQMIYVDVNNGSDLTGNGTQLKPFRTIAGVYASNPSFGTKQAIYFQGVGNSGGGSLSLTHTTTVYMIFDQKVEMNTTLTMPSTCGGLYIFFGAITADIVNNSTVSSGYLSCQHQVKIQGTITNNSSNYCEVQTLASGDAMNVTNAGASLFSVRGCTTVNKLLNTGVGSIGAFSIGTAKQPIEKTNGYLFCDKIDNITADSNGYCIISSGTNAGILGVGNVNFLQADFATKGKINQVNSNASHVTYLGNTTSLHDSSVINGYVSYTSDRTVFCGTLAKRPSAITNASKHYLDENGLLYLSNGATWTQIGYGKSALDTLLNAKEPAITAGTSTQVLLGNKTLQAINTLAVLSATKLATPRSINGVSFDGTADITIADSTKQPLDYTLTALAGLDTTGGLVSQTGTDTFAKRTISGSNGISIADGDGVAGNPTISPNYGTVANTVAQGNDGRFITTEERNKLLLLSGTNTGDQDLSGLVVKANNGSDFDDRAITIRNLLGTSSLDADKWIKCDANGTPVTTPAPSGTGNVSTSGQTGATGKLAIFANDSATTLISDPTLSHRQIASRTLGFAASFSNADVTTLNGSWIVGDRIYNTSVNLTLRYTSAGTWVDANARVGEFKDVQYATEELGWRNCYGRNVSRVDFPEAFIAFGTTHGAGDGSTTFTEPNFMGAVAGYAGTRIDEFTFLPTDINTASDIITVPAKSNLNSGDKVVFTTTGIVPASLTLNAAYTVTRVSTTTIKLSTFSTANTAYHAGTYINFVTTGNGVGTGVHKLTKTLTTRNLGDYVGEETHLNTVSETAPHPHDILADSGSGIGSGSTTDRVLNNADGAQQNVASGRATEPAGGGQAHNNMQPTVFINKQYFIGR